MAEVSWLPVLGIKIVNGKYKKILNYSKGFQELLGKYAEATK
jgi:hypothetical protein